MISAHERHDTTDSAAAVVSHVRNLIDHGRLKPGDRLPPERDLARHVGVSRPTVRAGLRTLAALGVVRSRRGSGTYIPDGPPTLGVEALSFIAALHKFTGDDVFEARRILEVGAAGLAAERATPHERSPHQVASVSSEGARGRPSSGFRVQGSGFSFSFAFRFGFGFSFSFSFERGTAN